MMWDCRDLKNMTVLERWSIWVGGVAGNKLTAVKAFCQNPISAGSK